REACEGHRRNRGSGEIIPGRHAGEPLRQSRHWRTREKNQNNRKIERVPQKTLRRHEATHEARHASSRPSIQTPRRVGEPSLDPPRQTAATVFRLAVRHDLSYAVQHDYSMAPSILVSGFHVCFCAMARVSDSRNSANAGRETELIGTGAPGAGR